MPGNVVFSLVVWGKDGETGVTSPDPDKRADIMFRYLQLFMDSDGDMPPNIG